MITTKVGNPDLHSSKTTQCVLYLVENYFDSYGRPTPKKIPIFLTGRNTKGVFPDCEIQKKTTNALLKV